METEQASDVIKRTGLDGFVDLVNNGTKEPCIGGCGQMVLTGPMILPRCRSCFMRDGEMDQEDRKAIKFGQTTYGRWAEKQVGKNGRRELLPSDVPSIPEAFKSAVPDVKTSGWVSSSDCILVISGTPGTGKTWQACGAMRAASRRHGADGVAMVKAAEVARCDHQTIEIIKRVPFLVLDDLAARITPGAMSTALEIIDARMDHRRKTIVTTNAGFEELAAIDPRMASRLASGVSYRMTGKDRRMPAKMVST